MKPIVAPRRSHKHSDGRSPLPKVKHASDFFDDDDDDDTRSTDHVQRRIASTGTENLSVVLEKVMNDVFLATGRCEMQWSEVQVISLVDVHLLFVDQPANDVEIPVMTSCRREACRETRRVFV